MASVAEDDDELIILQSDVAPQPAHGLNSDPQTLPRVATAASKKTPAAIAPKPTAQSTTQPKVTPQIAGKKRKSGDAYNRERVSRQKRHLKWRERNQLGLARKQETWIDEAGMRRHRLISNALVSHHDAATSTPPNALVPPRPPPPPPPSPPPAAQPTAAPNSAQAPLSLTSAAALSARPVRGRPGRELLQSDPNGPRDLPPVAPKSQASTATSLQAATSPSTTITPSHTSPPPLQSAPTNHEVHRPPNGIQTPLTPGKRLFLIPQRPEDKVQEIRMTRPDVPGGLSSSGGPHRRLTAKEQQAVNEYEAQQSLIRSRSSTKRVYQILDSGGIRWIPVGNDVVDERGLQLTLTRVLSLEKEDRQLSASQTAQSTSQALPGSDVAVPPKDLSNTQDDPIELSSSASYHDDSAASASSISEPLSASNGASPVLSDGMMSLEPSTDAMDVQEEDRSSGEHYPTGSEADEPGDKETGEHDEAASGAASKAPSMSMTNAKSTATALPSSFFDKTISDDETVSNARTISQEPAVPDDGKFKLPSRLNRLVRRTISGSRHNRSDSPSAASSGSIRSTHSPLSTYPPKPVARI